MRLSFSDIFERLDIIKGSASRGLNQLSYGLRREAAEDPSLPYGGRESLF
jgi:hypothetical protein